MSDNLSTKNFEVISFGRKYYKCKLNNYTCKLISELKLEDNKKYDLLVKDISVRSKFGTDLIFEVVAENKKDENSEIVSLKVEKFNNILVDKCKKLGGKWDSESKIWIFNKFVEKEVEELDYIYNSELINIEIKALQNVYAGPSKFGKITIFGYEICRAFGRDSGAVLNNDIALISGKCTSGGSMKNWVAEIIEGSIFRLSIPKNLLDFGNDEWDIKLI